MTVTAPGDRATSVRSLTAIWSPSGTLGALALAIVIVGGAFAIERGIDLLLSDEGFLWYGAWRTMLGELPIRDFDSYDPGRYYWAALWLKALGNDVLTLRLAMAVLHAGALFISLLLLRRVTRSPWLLSAAAVVIACWLFPRHKAFEPLVSIIGTYVVTRVIESPTVRTIFSAGLVIGIGALVGRNHGVYLLLASLATLAWLRLRHGMPALARDVVVLGAGVLAGYAPMLALIAFVPGFASAFADYFQHLLRNVPLPVSWTWDELSRDAPILENARLAALGCLHLLAPAMYAYLVVRLIKDARSGARTPPVIAAATFVGVAYLHYMFFRADIRHFAQAVTPLLVGWAALLAASRHTVPGRVAAVVALSFVALTVVSAVPERPIVQYWMGGERYRTVSIKGHPQIVQPGVGRAIEATADLAQRLAPDDRVLILPNWPALYVLLDRRAPIRESYTLAPEDAERQRQIIRELTAQDVRWVIVNDLGASRRRAEFSVQKTHPLVWEHIVSHYAPEPLPGAPKNYLLFRAMRHS